MLYVRLAGGLGNQIFQLAAALRLRESKSEKIILYTESLSKYSALRDFELANFFDLPSLGVFVDDISSIRRFLIKNRIGRLPVLGCSDDNYHNTNRENRTYFPLKELNQKDTLYRIVTTISFGDSMEDNSPIINRYNRCIEIATLMDSTYLTNNHDSMKIKFYYENKPSNDYCICKIRNLGSNQCPFQNYINKFSTKHI